MSWGAVPGPEFRVQDQLQNGIWYLVNVSFLEPVWFQNNLHDRYDFRIYSKPSMGSSSNSSIGLDWASVRLPIKIQYQLLFLSDLRDTWK